MGLSELLPPRTARPFMNALMSCTYKYYILNRIRMFQAISVIKSLLTRGVYTHAAFNTYLGKMSFRYLNTGVKIGGNLLAFEAARQLGGEDGGGRNVRRSANVVLLAAGGTGAPGGAGGGVQCAVCGRRYSNASNLRQHVRLIHEAQPVVCGTCGRSFKTPLYLRRHTLAQHPPARLHAKPPPPPLPALRPAHHFQ